jgi:hypothetical protein
VLALGFLFRIHRLAGRHRNDHYCLRGCSKN